MSDRVVGLLLGTAVGDSLGLPREGLSPGRAARLYRGPLRQRFVFGRGMLSDDTEHACMTAQALLASDEPARFATILRGKLRWWLLGLPPGIGWGTLRSIARSFVGLPAVRSAGNGAAMRAPILGAWTPDPDHVTALVTASTALTHRDPQALAGALAIAHAARHAVHGTVSPAILDDLRARIADRTMRAALDRVEAMLDREPAEHAAALGLARGVTGYVMHTVPVVLHAWLRAPADVRRVLDDVIALGGDADTTGAIAGALVGASAGASAIPPEWLAIADWPRSLAWLRRLADRVATRGAPLPLAWPAIPLRNLGFLAVAIVTALRRALPPY